MNFTFYLLSTHADRQCVDISFTVCLCVFVRLRISPSRIKLAASNFVRRFIGFQGREAPIFVNFAPQKPKIKRIGQRAGHAYRDVNITVGMRRRKRHARDAPFVKSRGMWTWDQHVWIYVSPPKRTYVLSTHADKQLRCGYTGYCLCVCLFVCVCVFVRLRISLAMIKLATSNFARWFRGVLDREFLILGNFAPQKPKIRRIRARR